MPSDEDTSLPGWGDDYVCHCDIGIVDMRRKDLVDAPPGYFAIPMRVVQYGFECRCGCVPVVEGLEAIDEDN